MALAQAEAAADPPVPPPAALRVALGFAKLPPRALADARRALDEDEPFRQRVRLAVAGHAEDEAVARDAGEAAVGEAGWLLLDRPAGWTERLDELVAADRAAEDEAAAERSERRATKRLDRTLVELAKAEQAAGDARSALAAEQQRRRGAEEELAAAGAERDRLAAERAEAVRQLKALEQRDAERVAVVHELQGRVAELESAVAAAEGDQGGAGGAGGADADADADADGAGGRGPAASDAGGAGAPPAPAGGPGGGAASAEAPVSPPLATAELARAVAEASAAADRLGDALRTAAGLLDPGGPAAGGEVPGAAGDAGPPLPAPSSSGADDGSARRRPSPLPGGLLDDTVEAARFLCRLPAAVLLVDGYNASMARWGELELPAQRRRLVDALRNLQARTGVEPVVVFDGAEPESGPSGSLPRSVQVRFSPPGVIADDVVVDLVDRYPHDRPVIVASSDAEVQQRARDRGANVVGTPQLLALLGD